MTYAPLHLGDAGVLRPGRLRWLRALGWMGALLGAVILMLALPALLGKAVALEQPARRTTAMIAVVLAYLAYAGLVRRGERRAPSEVALRPFYREFGIGVAVGLGMFALVFTLLRVAGAYTLAPGVWTDWGADLIRDVSTGLVEELLLRLILFRLLMRAAGLWPALIGSALLFGVLHLVNPNSTLVAAVAIAVEAGLMLAAFYLLTGRIWMSVGVHAAWNFAQGAIFGARVSGNTDTGSLFVSAPASGAPDWLSGGAFGPEASLPAVLVGLAVFAVVMRRYLVAPGTHSTSAAPSSFTTRAAQNR
jgi:uncharacterized protein